MKVVSPTGRIVYQQSFDQESLVTVWQKLSPGIYLVQVLGGKKVVTRKLVIR